MIKTTRILQSAYSSDVDASSSSMARRLERLSPEERHRIRIEAKKLRYAAEFFSQLFVVRKHRQRYRVFIAALGDLGLQLATSMISRTSRKLRQSSVRRSRARRAAVGRLGDQNERAAALLIAACEAHQRVLDAKLFWR